MISKQVIQQFFIFGLIGAAGLVVNMVLYTLLVKTVLLDHELIANILSTILTILFNWFWNRVLTFKSKKQAHTEMLQFFIVSGLALPLNALAMYFSRDVLGYKTLLSDNLSIVVATVAGMVLKFILYKIWVFKVKD